MRVTLIKATSLLLRDHARIFISPWFPSFQDLLVLNDDQVSMAKRFIDFEITQDLFSFV